jgi:hypothetical protein
MPEFYIWQGIRACDVAVLGSFVWVFSLGDGFHSSIVIDADVTTHKS